MECLRVTTYTGDANASNIGRRVFEVEQDTLYASDQVLSYPLGGLRLEERRGSLIDAYLNNQVCLHIHLVVEAGAELPPGEFCTLIKVEAVADTPTNERQFTDNYDRCFSLHTSAQMESPVLINDVELMEDSKNRDGISFQQGEWLQPDDCPACFVVQNASHFVEAASTSRFTSLLCLLEKDCLVVIDRKLRSREFLTGVPNREVSHGVIEGRPQVVENLTQDYRPAKWNPFRGIVSEQLFTGSHILLLPDLVRLVSEEGCKVRFKSFQLLPGTFDLRLRTLEKRHEVSSLHERQDQAGPTNTEDPEGSRDTDPHARRVHAQSEKDGEETAALNSRPTEAVASQTSPVRPRGASSATRTRSGIPEDA